LEELKALNERYENLSIEHALVTNSSSSVSQLEKDNFELKARLDELSRKYNVLQANHVHLKCSHEKLVESHFMLEVAHEVVITSIKSSQPLLENHELKEEVERLRKDVIRLKGKDEAEPSQDNRDNMVKKLVKGSNLAPSKIQQKNHNSSNVKATKSKKHGRRLCYGCGLYGHEWAMCPRKS
jgi:hypothetical protein